MSALQGQRLESSIAYRCGGDSITSKSDGKAMFVRVDVAWWLCVAGHIACAMDSHQMIFARGVDS